MPFEDDLRERLEREEAETVGTSFGGTASTTHGSYSVPSIRDWILSTNPPPSTPLSIAIHRARTVLTRPLFKHIIGCLVRYSFLIELTNLTVGSTKMKTRWIPGLILMPQAGSFEPIQRQLTADLVGFDGFPDEVKQAFVEQGLVTASQAITCCPVTLQPLSFATLSTAVLTSTHGVSDYQIGHLHPLKRGGKHEGANVRWQSADGNRIQGDLTIEETNQLLETDPAPQSRCRPTDS